MNDPGDNLATPIGVLAVVADDDRVDRLRRRLGPVAQQLVTCRSLAEARQQLAGRTATVILLDQPAGEATAEALAWLRELGDRVEDSYRILTATEETVAVALLAVNDGEVDAICYRSCGEEELRNLVNHGRETARTRRRHRRLHRELIHRNRQLENFNQNLEQEVRDRTRSLQQANRQLRQYNDELVRLETQATLTHLIRGLAHEINNPLSVILGQAQRLQYTVSGDEKVDQRLKSIVDEVGRCITLVGNLRSFSASVTKELRSVGFRDVVDRATERLAKRSLPVPQVVYAGDDEPALADRESLAQAVEQILDNAARAGAKRVTIRQEVVDGQVKIGLGNDGATPTDEEIHHAIRPFFTTRRAERPGLGLALAASLLRDQGGTITFDRAPDGPGALVTISLAEASTQNDEDSGILVPRPDPPVLVVEDDPMVTELIVGAMADIQKRSVTAIDLAEAERYVRYTSVTGLCCSLEIGVGRLGDFLQELVSAQPKITGRIVVIGQDDQRPAAKALMAAHACHFLPSDASLKQVRTLLKQVFA